jgi:hypothetical protein
VKPKHFLLPIAALGFVGSWIGIQRRALATLEDENGRLVQQAVPAAKPGFTDELFPELEKRRASRTINFGGLPEWHVLAELLAGRRNGRPDARGLAEFDKLVKAMGNEELVTKIEEILTLDLEEEARWNLINEFLRPLIDQDPELALRRLFGQLGTEDRALSSAWSGWSKKDVGAATAWFDEQIVAGKVNPKRLDGSDGCRVEFEGQLVKLLLTSDPAAAARRMADLPVEMRERVINHSHDSQADAPTQKAWADLVRSQLPAKDALERIGGLVPDYVENSDFSKVMNYMETIAATPAERSACVTHTINNWTRYTSVTGKVTVEGIEALRTWADAQEPELSKNLTRGAIEDMLKSNQQSAMTLEQVETIVAHYQGMEGGDEMLAQALERTNLNHRREYVRALASRIPDEERRAKILKKLENR